MTKKTLNTHDGAQTYVCQIAPLTLQEKEELKERISNDIDKALETGHQPEC